MRKAVLVIFAVAILGLISISQSKKPASSLPNTTAVKPMSSSNSSMASKTMSSSTYKDGTYNGSAAETPYGIVQVAAIIVSGKITEINFLQMPSDQNHSQEITTYSEPYLEQTALDKQNAKNIEFVTGATSTSYGFQESLQAALNQAATS